MKIVPPSLRLAVCVDCNKVLGMILDDMIYGDGIRTHLEEKGHDSIQVIKIERHMIKSLLDELGEEHQDSSEPDEQEPEEEEDEEDEPATEQEEQEFQKYKQAIKQQGKKE